MHGGWRSTRPTARHRQAAADSEGNTSSTATVAVNAHDRTHSFASRPGRARSIWRTLPRQMNWNEERFEGKTTANAFRPQPTPRWIRCSARTGLRAATPRYTRSRQRRRCTSEKSTSRTYARCMLEVRPNSGLNTSASSCREKEITGQYSPRVHGRERQLVSPVKTA